MDRTGERHGKEDSNGIPESGDILDFSDGKLDWCNHGGIARKKTLQIGNTANMVKIPDRTRNPESYRKSRFSPFSEYVGCHIYGSLGILVQKTYLGKYDDHGQKVVAVACRDFQNDGIQLYPMQYIHPADPFAPSFPGKLTLSSLSVRISNLEDKPLEQQAADRYWSMTVVDYLIGNSSRSLEDWGMAAGNTGQLFPAPVYDCGRSLLAEASDEELDRVMREDVFANKCLDVQTALFDETTRNRMTFGELLKDPCPDLQRAILEIVPRIDLDVIRRIIRNTPFMPDIRRQAMMESIRVRYEQVLLPVYETLRSVNRDAQCHSSADGGRWG
ncbi:hypothetical protein [Faecalibaculum rodentium]|uniref:hypothetical protein n=1 Tax=Faecalibaculum rodentium TaxID=1702221 RepID=UPI0023EF6563|nr:hypothetical protein [Faecalibaculum rodentium]